MGNADGLMGGLALLAGLTGGLPGAVVAGLVALVVQSLRRQPDLLRLMLVLLIALLGAGRTAMVTHGSSPAALSGSKAAIGRVASMPVTNGEGQHFLLRVDRVQHDATWTDTTAVVYVTTQESRVNVGDRIWVAWQVDPVDRLEPGFGGYVRSLGAVASGRAFAVRVESPGTAWQRRFVQLRAAFGRSLQRAAPGDAGALLAGMVTGDDGQLATATRDEFRVTQTSHITAVSGSNLSMVAGLWAILGASGTLRRRSWYQALVSGTIIGYAILVGLEPPAVRAAIVTLLAVLSVRFGRRPDPLTLLVLTAAAMTFANPVVTSSLGFQLSMASSVALVACLPGALAAGRAKRSWITFSVLTVLCAQLATLPLLIATFGAWSPIGLVANVLIAPLVPIATYAGAVAAVAGLVWAPFGNVLGWLAAWPADGILLIVHRCALVARPLPLSGAGDLGLVMVTLIAVVALLTFSPETRRFAGDLRLTWLTSPSTIALAAGSCALGAIMTLTVVVALT